MIETFRNWINALLCLGIFTTIIQLIMPKNKIRKYINSLIGIITIITVVTPGVSFVKNKNMEETLAEVVANIDNYENIDEQKYKNINEESVKKSFVSSLELDIINKLSQNGVEIKMCEVFIDEEYNIEKIEINIENVNNSKTKIDNITQIAKYINEEYDVGVDKITVIEEGM